MKNIFRRYIALLTVGALLISGAFPAAGAVEEVEKTPQFVDMPEKKHWAYDALQRAIENDLLHGYDDGTLRPSGTLSRAEFATILNRIFGIQEAGDVSAYTDVRESAWYYNEIEKAVGVGTLNGSGMKLFPEQPISREDVFLAFSQALKLTTEDLTILNGYTDHEEISQYAKPAIAAMLKMKYINGYDDKTIRPHNQISRQEFAKMLQTVFQRHISSAGTYTGDENGTVIINVPSVTIKDAHITGDVIVGDGVGNGEVVLDHVTVDGRVLVRGGGDHSIRIINGSNIGSVIVTKSSKGALRVLSSEGARVDMLLVDDGEDGVILEGTFKNVIVSDEVAVVLKNVDVTNLTMDAPKANVSIESGSISSLSVNAKATQAELNIASEATLGNLNICSGTTCNMDGKVAMLTIMSTEGQSPAVVSLGENAAINTMTVQYGAETVINAEDNAKIDVIRAENVSDITIGEASADKEAAIEQKIKKTVAETSNESSGSWSGSSSGNSGSNEGSGNTPIYTPEEGTLVTTEDEFLAACQDDSVSQILVNGVFSIENDVSCIKTITVSKTANIEFKGYVTLFGALNNNGKITTSGSLHITEKGSLINGGVIQNPGVWYVYGSVQNTGSYFENYGPYAVRIFPGATMLGMPKLTALAMDNVDYYYADGTSRLNLGIGNIMTNGPINLVTSATNLVYVAGQTGYDNAMASGKNYGGLYLIPDSNIANNTVTLAESKTFSMPVSIEHGTALEIPSGTWMYMNGYHLEVGGTLKIGAGAGLSAQRLQVNPGGAVDNRGTFDVDSMDMYAESTALGMPAIEIRGHNKLGDSNRYTDYYYSDGTSLIQEEGKFHITGQATLYRGGATIAYASGAEGLKNVMNAARAYSWVYLIPDDSTAGENVVINEALTIGKRLYIGQGVNVAINCPVIATNDIFINGQMSIGEKGTYTGRGVWIKEGATLTNSGRLALQGGIDIYGGKLDNRGKIDTEQLWQITMRDGGTALNLPEVFVYITDGSAVFYADGSADKGSGKQSVVTGKATVTRNSTATVYGPLGLKSALEDENTYSQYRLYKSNAAASENESLIWDESAKVDQLYISEGVELTVAENCSLEVNGIYSNGDINIDQGAWVTVENEWSCMGGCVENRGTVTVNEMLYVKDGSYVVTEKDAPVFYKGKETSFINFGTLVNNGYITIYGPDASMTQTDGAYWANYVSSTNRLRVEAGGTLTVHGDVNMDSTVHKGFYTNGVIRTYSYTYVPDVILKSKVISDQEIATFNSGETYVYSEEGLRYALENNLSGVELQKSITLTKDLTLDTKIRMYGTITVPADITLTIADSGALQYGALKMAGGTARLQGSLNQVDSINIDAGTVFFESGTHSTSNIFIGNEGTVEVGTGAQLSVGSIQGTGVLVNRGTITLKLSVEYGNELIVPEIDNQGGTINGSVAINVYTANDLWKANQEEGSYSQFDTVNECINFWGDELTVTDEQELAKSVCIYAPLTVAKGGALVMGRATLFDRLVVEDGGYVKATYLNVKTNLVEISGTLESATVYGIKDFQLKHGGTGRIKDYWQVVEAYLIDGTLVLEENGCIELRGEGTINEQNDIQMGKGSSISVSGTMHQLGNVVIPEEAEINNSGYYEILGTLTNQGQVYNNCDADLYINNGAELINNGKVTNSGTLKVQALGTLTNHEGATIDNEGTLQVNDGGQATVVHEGDITGSGVLKGEITVLEPEEVNTNSISIELPEEYESEKTYQISSDTTANGHLSFPEVVMIEIVEGEDTRAIGPEESEDTDEQELPALPETPALEPVGQGTEETGKDDRDAEVPDLPKTSNKDTMKDETEETTD